MRPNDEPFNTVSLDNEWPPALPLYFPLSRWQFVCPLSDFGCEWLNGLNDRHCEALYVALPVSAVVFIDRAFCFEEA